MSPFPTEIANTLKRFTNTKEKIEICTLYSISKGNIHALSTYALKNIVIRFFSDTNITRPSKLCERQPLGLSRCSGRCSPPCALPPSFSAFNFSYWTSPKGPGVPFLSTFTWNAVFTSDQHKSKCPTWAQIIPWLLVVRAMVPTQDLAPGAWLLGDKGVGVA